ncbi:MAG: helix-turn-helix domain-containing protein [Rhizobacter sp.]|nr:helix-turn-helix domain-containing protein [Chlorobiales bacterium]
MITTVKNKSDFNAALTAIEPFLKKGFARLSKKEIAELERLTTLIAAYEDTLKLDIDEPLTIAEMLELKMFEMKLSQKQLAEKLEITATRLSEVMNGKRKVNADLAKRLYKKLHVDPKFILEAL